MLILLLILGTFFVTNDNSFFVGILCFVLAAIIC